LRFLRLGQCSESQPSEEQIAVLKELAEETVFD